MELEWWVGALVLATALLHASWNAVIKTSRDRLLTTATVMATGGLLGVGILPFVVLPNVEAWRYLAASSVIHTVYVFLLVRSYQHGDLSQVYPIARGLAPLGVALLSARFAGEIPTPAQGGALLLVSIGVGSLAFATGSPGTKARGAIGIALVNGLLIGLYTFIDGQGVRVSGNAFAYVLWHAVFAAVPVSAVALVRRRGRVRTFLADEGRKGLAAGAMAWLGYAIVLWAMGQGSMAIVASIRETSVVMGALIGALWLGEGLGARRVGAATVVVVGIAVLNLSPALPWP